MLHDHDSATDQCPVRVLRRRGRGRARRHRERRGAALDDCDPALDRALPVVLDVELLDPGYPVAQQLVGIRRAQVREHDGEQTVTDVRSVRPFGSGWSRSSVR